MRKKEATLVAAIRPPTDDNIEMETIGESQDELNWITMFYHRIKYNYYLMIDKNNFS